MAMDPRDVKLPRGDRQPTQTVRRKGSEWRGFHRAFDATPLGRALAGFGVAKVRVR